MRNSICRSKGLAFRHTRLNFRRTAQSVDDATKLDQQAVACGLYYPALVLPDFGVDHFTPMRLQQRKRAFLVRSHQPRIASDIGGQDRSDASSPTAIRTPDKYS